jgi:hypothetical protein
MGPTRVDILVDLAPFFVGVILINNLVEDREHPERGIAAGGKFFIRNSDHASRLRVEDQRGNDGIGPRSSASSVPSIAAEPSAALSAIDPGSFSCVA